MTALTSTFDPLEAKRREQLPQALARLVIVGLFIVLWAGLWLARIPMPFPFLVVLLIEALFFLGYCRVIGLWRSIRALELAQYGMLAAEIIFHTTMVYFLGGISWLGPFAYVFGLIFANAFLDMRRGLIYTGGACAAFFSLVLLDATGVIPHYTYLDQGPLRYTDTEYVATTIVGGLGVFFTIYVWINWVGHELRRQRDKAVQTQAALLHARAELERRVVERTADLERANAALRESEERLRTVVSNTPIVLFVMDCDGVFTLSEGKGLETLGLKPGEVVGQSAFELYRDAPMILDHIRRALAGETLTATVELGELGFQTHYAPVRDQRGEVVGLMGVAIDVTERMQAEEALREREARNRALLEAIPDMIVRINGDGTILDYKPSLDNDAPGAVGELVGRSIYEFLTGEVGEAANAHIGQALETGAPQIYEFPLSREGEDRFREARIVACGEDEVLTIVRDVTERKRTEEALRESEEVLTATIESTADGILVVGNNGQVVYANQLFASMWRIPKELLETRDDDQLLAFVLDQLEDPETFLAKVRELYETSREGFDVLRFKDGRVFERYSLPLLRDGEVAGRVWSFRDVSERQRAEEALRESESKFRVLADTVAAAVFVFQGEQMQYVNPAGQAITGYTHDEILRMNFWDVIHPEFRELIKRRGMARQSGKRVPRRYEVKLLTKGGQERWVDFTAGLIEYHGSPAVVGTAFDITERKRAEEALRDQARRDPLTGVLNHAAIVEELRTLAADGAEGYTHVVVMTDVDGLKAINDLYGHQLGDEALLNVAKALSLENAVIGRYGGDEFVSILRGCDRAGAERYRAEVLSRLAEVQAVDPDTGARVPIIVSLGLAVYPNDAQTVHELIQVSDSAMYAAKRQRPVGGKGFPFQRPLGTDRAAELVGQLVPLLTAPGDVNDKLKLVSHRLSIGAGYDAVTFSVFAPVPGESLAASTFARAPEELVEAWNTSRESEQHLGPTESHPVRTLLEGTKRPLILDDPWNDERLWENQRGILRAADLRSALVAPLIWEDNVVGLIGVASKREHAFGPSDAQFLATVASQVTAIIRMATLFQELQSTSKRLAHAQEESVILLAAAAEAHDHTTGRHLHNLRSLTETLAKELGHNEGEARDIGLAAILHDIGKIRVPESVLARPGELAEEEWELMQHHTTWGAHFLAGHAGFELAARIARSHHERWDGTGYPDGLAGDAIPNAAAIVTVADAFDAITSDRPYRKARSIAAAVREIGAHAGKQFSPRVAEALERLHKRRELRTIIQERDERAA